MRQGGCTPCRIGIMQPEPTHGATAHARHYEPVGLFKPVSRCYHITTTSLRERSHAIDDRTRDHAWDIALDEQRGQLPNRPTVFRYRHELGDAAMGAFDDSYNRPLGRFYLLVCVGNGGIPGSKSGFFALMRPPNTMCKNDRMLPAAMGADSAPSVGAW